MAETSPCPRCGAPGTGNFCSECGASRGRAACPDCGHTPEAGARFCTRCGRALGAAAGAPPGDSAPGAAPASEAGGAARSSTLGWWVAGLALVALILFVAYPVVTGTDGAPAPAGGTGAGGRPAGAPPDLGSMTPTEAADRLYVRVKEAAARGDSTEMRMFLPMAVAAHERALPLDDDRLFHLAQLELWADNPTSAMISAQELLDRTPTHLLGLGAAAASAEASGDEAVAEEYWARFLEVYDREMATGREDYEGHPEVISAFRARARQVAGR